MKTHKILAIMLTVCMILTMIPTMVFADASVEDSGVNLNAKNFSDVTGHWASDAINKWEEVGILKGDERGFRPNDSITRAEMAVVLDNLMDYQVKAKNTFSDVNNSAWYADAVLKANAAGILNGDGVGHANPLEKITREQAAVMLARAFGVDENNGSKTSFKDASSISPWAKSFVFGMEEDKYIGGVGGGNFAPKTNITRAQVVTMIDNAVAAYYTTAKTYSENVAPKVVGANCVTIVRADGITIKGSKISGDLIIAEGVSQGNFTLDGTTVTGKLITRGGGKNSIHIINGAEVKGKVSVEKVDGTIRIVSDGVTIANLDANTEVVLEGDFTNVAVAEGAMVEVKGQVKNISIEAKADVTIAKEAKVESLTVQKDAEGTKVTVDGTVTNVKTEAQKTQISATDTAKITTIEATSTATGTDISVDKKADIKTIESATTITTSGEGTAKQFTGTGTITDKETGQSVATTTQVLGGGGGGSVSNSTNNTDSTNYLISGVVSLPDNQIATTGGVLVTLSTGELTVKVSSGGDGAPYSPPTTPNQEVINPHYVYTSVIIPEGSTSAAYSLNVPIGKYTIRYNTSDMNYVEKGYYGSSSTVENSASACEIDVSKDVLDKNIKLIKGYVIHGNVLLPNSETASEGGVTVNVSLGNISSEVTIPSGATSTAYTLRVPAGTYKLSYNTSNLNYVSKGYYSTTGIVHSNYSASSITVNGTISNLDIELEKGYLISGTISLPDNETATSDGESLFISTANIVSPPGPENFSTSACISEGTKSIAYMLRVPSGTYKLMCITSSSKYTPKVYYNEANTAWNYSLAQNITATVDSTGNDITLIKRYSISGTVSLPNNETASTGGVYVTISNSYGGGSITSDTTQFSTTIVIPKGATSAAYTLNVPMDTHKIEYCTTNENYISKGYYSTIGTVPEFIWASSINVTNNISDMDLELLKEYAISGTVSLPNNKIAPEGGIDVRVGTSVIAPAGIIPSAGGTSYDHNNYRSTNVTIEAGTTSAAYTLKVPKGSYKIGYTASNPNYLPRGYYSTSGMVQEYYSASNIVVSENVDNKNIELVEGYILSGTVSLPNNDIAPEGGITVSLDAGSNIPILYSVTIPEGATSAAYSIRVSPGTHKLSYITSSPNYVSRGYYNTNGTVQEYSLASDIMMNEDVSGKNIVLLAN